MPDVDFDWQSVDTGVLPVSLYDSGVFVPFIRYESNCYYQLKSIMTVYNIFMRRTVVTTCIVC